MVEINVEVDILEYIGEVETADLVGELIERAKTPKATIGIIRELLGLREHHAKGRIVEEIVNLMDLA